MGLRVNNNISSINAQRNLATTTDRLSKSLQRLSSGLRITRAADDAAGLAISENFRAEVRSLGQSQRNANDAISLLQIAEGALNETSGILIRMRELSIQASNGTLGSTERTTIDAGESWPRWPLRFLRAQLGHANGLGSLSLFRRRFKLA